MFLDLLGFSIFPHASLYRTAFPHKIDNGTTPIEALVHQALSISFSSTMEVTSQRYRTAVAVNNVGVEMLQRQCYRQAVATFRDAAALMKCIVSNSDENKDSFCSLLPAQSLESSKHPLQHAVRSLTHSKPTKTAALLIEVLTSTQDGTVFHNTTLQSLLKASPSSSKAFPVRIEDDLLLEVSACYLPRSPELSVQAAMICHNLGLAYLCQSKVTKAARRPRHLRSALYWLQKSHLVLLKRYGTLQPVLHHHLQGDVLEVESILSPRTLELPFLIIGVLISLICALYESMQNERALKLYDTLVQLRLDACAVETIRSAWARLSPAA